MIRKTQHTGFLIFLSLVLITSCGTRGDKVEFETSSGEPIIRIMPLGNSITYGNYHPEQRPEGLITGYRQSLWQIGRAHV